MPCWVAACLLCARSPHARGDAGQKNKRNLGPARLAVLRAGGGCNVPRRARPTCWRRRRRPGWAASTAPSAPRPPPLCRPGLWEVQIVIIRVRPRSWPRPDQQASRSRARQPPQSARRRPLVDHDTSTKRQRARVQRRANAWAHLAARIGDHLVHHARWGSGRQRARRGRRARARCGARCCKCQPAERHGGYGAKAIPLMGVTKHSLGAGDAEIPCKAGKQQSSVLCLHKINEDVLPSIGSPLLLFKRPARTDVPVQ